MPPTRDEVLFEIRVVGTSARVSAIHVPSNTEVTVICPSKTPRGMMEQAAINKLKYVLGRPRE